MAGNGAEMFGLNQGDLTRSLSARVAVTEQTAREVEICDLKLNNLFTAARPDPEPHDLACLHRGIEKLSKGR